MNKYQAMVVLQNLLLGVLAFDSFVAMCLWQMDYKVSAFHVLMPTFMLMGYVIRDRQVKV